MKLQGHEKSYIRNCRTVDVGCETVKTSDLAPGSGDALNTVSSMRVTQELVIS